MAKLRGVSASAATHASVSTHARKEEGSYWMILIRPMMAIHTCCVARYGAAPCTCVCVCVCVCVCEHTCMCMCVFQQSLHFSTSNCCTSGKLRV